MAVCRKKLGKTNRRKGHNFEREIVNAIGGNAKRILEYQQGMGYDVEYGRLRIQCKRGKSYAPINRIEEVEQGMKNNNDSSSCIPALVTKADRKRTVVALYLDDFLKIYEGYELCNNIKVTSEEIQSCWEL